MGEKEEEKKTRGPEVRDLVPHIAFLGIETEARGRVQNDNDKDNAERASEGERLFARIASRSFVTCIIVVVVVVIIAENLPFTLCCCWGGGGANSRRAES